ncbi:MAG: glutathione S-transferase family protein, partial [Myxococcota bacterium]
KGEHKNEPFLKLNPTGRVPALKDGEFCLWEANAILSFLADAYSPAELVGANPKERGLIQQWMDWQNTDLGPALLAPWHLYYFQMLGTPVEPEAHRSAVERTRAPLTILDAHLKERSFILGERLTLADIVVGESVDLSGFGQTPLEDFPEVVRWHESLKTRVPFQNTRWR